MLAVSYSKSSVVGVRGVSGPASASVAASKTSCNISGELVRQPVFLAVGLGVLAVYYLKSSIVGVRGISGPASASVAASSTSCSIKPFCFLCLWPEMCL